MEHLATCSLCEACCACKLHIENNQIIAVEADAADPFSESFICQKGRSIPELEAHPKRLHQPLVKRDGVLQTATWDEAFARAEEILAPIIAEHGNCAVGVYVGNGAAHNSELSQYLEPLATAANSINFFTSGTLDQVPRQVVSGLMYGSQESVPVPDIDHCDFLCIIGANPAESNGSLWTVPGIIKRLARLKTRGGKLCVIDPQTSRTAKLSDHHLAVVPGTDAWLLGAVAKALLSAGHWRKSPAAAHLQAVERLVPDLDPFTVDRAAHICGVSIEAIETLIENLKTTNRAAVYGRMGTTTQQFASLTVWLIDLVNMLAGSFDSEGGVMFVKPLAAQNNSYPTPQSNEGFIIGKWHSRVNHYPEVMGELPVCCLPEEINTDGEGQIRAMICIAANPLISNINTTIISNAFKSLQGLISLDIHMNETAQLADVVFPSPPKLARCNYDRYFYQFTVRNYARYTQAYRTLRPEEKDDREIALRLAAILRGEHWHTDIDAIDEIYVEQRLQQEINRPGSKIADVPFDHVKKALSKLPAKERMLDLDIRTGPYGDGFGSCTGINLATLKDSPHGLDMGPLEPRLPKVLRTVSGKIEVLQEFALKELKVLEAMELPVANELRMVGRRQLSSNNSWMHHIPSLQTNRNLCELLISEHDADRLKLKSGNHARVSRDTRSLEVVVKVTSDIRPGVVSLPHGWGHQTLCSAVDSSGIANPGVNVNLLTDISDADSLTNTACLNGYTIAISPCNAFAEEH